MRARTVIVASLPAILFAGACADEPIGRRGSDRNDEITFGDEPIVQRGPLENGMVVFTGVSSPGDYGPQQLYSMEEDGTDIRQLTDDRNYKTAVASSPDGSRIAYAAFDSELTLESPAPDPSSIFVMEADGSGREQLCEACARTAYTFEPQLGTVEGDLHDDTIDAVPHSLAWSPGGSTLAVPAVIPGVLLIDVETGRTMTVPTPEPITSIAWAPDGRRLALSHTWFTGMWTSLGIMVPTQGTLAALEPVERPGGIYVLDLDTGHLDEVVSSPRLAGVHGWSSEGDRIVFTRSFDEHRTGEISVYSVSEDRTWTVVPGELGAAPLGVGWSPADDAIAALVVQYDEDVQDAKDLWVTSLGEAKLQALPVCGFDGAFDGDDCAHPTMVWSPDGTTVAYRASIRGTPMRSALVLQGIEGLPVDAVEIDEAAFDVRSPCCLIWLPRPG